MSDSDLHVGNKTDPGLETSAEISRSSTNILEVNSLTKRFGGIVAVNGATFAVEEKSITGLIGPNGAGKSTTFDLITGVQRPDSGSVRFRNESITGLPTHEIANIGLIRTFQITRVLPGMTVMENMMLAPQHQLGESLWRSVIPRLPFTTTTSSDTRNGLRSRLPRTRSAVISQEREFAKRAWETLEFFEIDHLADEDAGNLSGGQRKLLEFARALLTDPDMLLLDEPMAGVNPTLERKILDRIHTLRDEGFTFLIVEHDMDVIMNNCEHVIVLHQGQVLAEGEPTEIQENEAVIDAYLGEGP